ncbi:hypothetical protein [Rhodoligotrophos ferricapiens]|uniref:hypothetical protein n=1 Tax=Rhodoligotrophos ferricapiens TaxID=3069264 RepID=UPI00315DD2F4
MHRPINPYLVLALAIVLPGMGHVAIGAPRRGLVFAFFTVFFGVFTYLFSSPDQSFIARHAGGIFIWALSIPDAYRRARLAYELAGRRES